MITEHDTRPCTPWAHSAYVGYDATIGRIASLSDRGKAHRCPACERKFVSADALEAHARAKHTGEGA